MEVCELGKWVVSVAVPALSGLGGVLLGGYLSSSRDQTQRKLAFIEKQLNEFYSPLAGIRNEIRSRGELRVRVHDAAGAVWKELSARAREAGPESVEQLVEERRAEFRRLIEYENDQLTKESIPAYKRMAATFRDKYWLAEPETTKYYQQLIDFIELWERWLSKSLAPEIVERLDIQEESLHPFYEHLEETTATLRQRLKRGQPE